jgi:predicted nuclease with RNAse H fold
MGLALSGGKNDKTTVVEISFFSDHKKLFLKEIHEKIGSTEDESGDSYLLKLLNQKDVKVCAVDAPLSLPSCLTHMCKGSEKCKSETTQWLWNQYKKHKKKKKNLKLFTPYTERCVERYINYDLEEFYEMPEALGSNKAPITARAVYLKSKVTGNLIEVYPKLSLHRIGRKLNISKSDLKNYRHAANGMECRMIILDALISAGIIFIYEQDIQKLIDSVYAFDALISALTAYMYYQNECELPPKSFPTHEGWVYFPKM